MVTIELSGPDQTELAKVLWLLEHDYFPCPTEIRVGGVKVVEQPGPRSDAATQKEVAPSPHDVEVRHVRHWKRVGSVGLYD